MSSIIKMKPFGTLVMSLYRTNGITEDTVSEFLNQEDILVLENQVYDKGLTCAQSYKDFQCALKYEKESKKSESNINLLSATAKKEYKKAVYADTCDKLRLSINEWFSSLGIRICKGKEEIKPIYKCTELDAREVSYICDELNNKETESEAYRHFLYILICASGEVLNNILVLKNSNVELTGYLKGFSRRNFTSNAKIKKREFDFKTCTLYIYRGLIGCFRDKHKIIGVNAIISTMGGVSVRLNVNYCTECSRFYISYDEYNYYIERYRFLLTKLVLDDSMSSIGGFGRLADKSPLKLCGYSVSQEKGLAQEEREHILYEMISSGIVSKPEAMQYIEWFIRFNGNREINHLARSKWESDLNYVRNLNLANQPNQKIDMIRPYRK